jgi:MFS family permease
MSMRSLLAVPDVRRLWLISLASCLGAEVSRVGFLLYVFQTRSSLLDLALIIALETVPGSLTAPVAGLVIDRVGPRRILAVTSVTRLMIALAVMARPSLGAIFAAVVAHSALSGCFQPAKLAAFPAVTRPSELPALNGLDQSGTNVMILLAPVLGAELLLRGGIAATLIVDALLCVAMLVLSAGARIQKVTSQQPQSILREMTEGWRFVANHPTVGPLLLQFFVALICIGVWMPLAPFFIQERFGDSGRMLGWQLSTLSGGAIIGAVAAPHFMRSWGYGPTMLAGLIAEGGAMTIYAVLTSGPLSMMTMGLWGVAAAVVAVPFYAMVQAIVDPSLSGRVLATIRQAESVALCVSMVIAVVVHQVLSASTILLVAGLAYVASAALFATSRRGAYAFRTVEAA